LTSTDPRVTHAALLYEHVAV